MADDSGATVGTITGYLRLDKSDWSAEIASAQGQADALGKSSPNIKIETNAPTAIAQLELVAAAAKRLQDAQGKVSVAQAKVNDLENSGKASASQLAAAHENLAKAMRDVELQQVRVAKAYNDGSSAGNDAENTVKKLSNSSEGLGLSFTTVLIPAIAALSVVIGPLAAVGAGAIGTILLGSKQLENQVKGGLTPAFDGLEAAAAKALGPGINGAVTQLQQALPKLTPLIDDFGSVIGSQVDELATYLNNGGIAKFANYAEQQLPIVTGLFDSAAKASVAFFSSTTTQGDTVIGTLTQVLNLVTLISQGYSELQVLASSKTNPFAAGFGTGVEEFLNPIGTAVNNFSAFKSSGLGAPVAGHGTEAPAGVIGPNQSHAAGLSGPVSYGVPIPDDAAALGGSLHDAIDSVAGTGIFQVQDLISKFADANTAVQSMLSSMNDFATSEDTAVDKGKLLGAVLVASQGDALSYAGAVASGYSADNALVQAFQSQAAGLAQQGTSSGSSAPSAASKDKSAAASERLQAADDKLASARKAGSKATSAQILTDEAAVSSARATAASTSAATAKSVQSSSSATAAAFANTELGAINLKTGLINLKSQGAGPLIQQLQAMQSAAENAAEATYEHEVSTQGDNKALSDAQTIFESMTRGTLVDNQGQLTKTAKSMGLTQAAAKGLADEYFQFDGKTVTTAVQSIGLNNVNDTLNQIGAQLALLTGKPWVIPVSADITGDFAANLAGSGPAGLHGAVNDIPLPAAFPSKHATGVQSLNEGLSWVGDGGMPELLSKSGPNVTVYSGARSKAKAPAAAAQQPIIIYNVTTLDGKVVAKNTNEVNMRGERR